MNTQHISSSITKLFPEFSGEMFLEKRNIFQGGENISSIESRVNTISFDNSLLKEAIKIEFDEIKNGESTISQSVTDLKKWITEVQDLSKRDKDKLNNLIEELQNVSTSSSVVPSYTTPSSYPYETASVLKGNINIEIEGKKNYEELSKKEKERGERVKKFREIVKNNERIVGKDKKISPVYVRVDKNNPILNLINSLSCGLFDKITYEKVKLTKEMYKTGKTQKKESSGFANFIEKATLGLVDFREKEKPFSLPAFENISEKALVAVLDDWVRKGLINNFESKYGKKSDLDIVVDFLQSKGESFTELRENFDTKAKKEIQSKDGFVASIWKKIWQLFQGKNEYLYENLKNSENGKTLLGLLILSEHAKKYKGNDPFLSLIEAMTKSNDEKYKNFAKNYLDSHPEIKKIYKKDISYNSENNDFFADIFREPGTNFLERHGLSYIPKTKPYLIKESGINVSIYIEKGGDPTQVDYRIAMIKGLEKQKDYFPSIKNHWNQIVKNLAQGKGGKYGNVELRIEGNNLHIDGYTGKDDKEKWHIATITTRINDENIKELGLTDEMLEGMKVGDNSVPGGVIKKLENGGYIFIGDPTNGLKINGSVYSDTLLNTVKESIIKTGATPEERRIIMDAIKGKNNGSIVSIKGIPAVVSYQNGHLSIKGVKSIPMHQIKAPVIESETIGIVDLRNNGVEKEYISAIENGIKGHNGETVPITLGNDGLANVTTDKNGNITRVAIIERTDKHTSTPPNSTTTQPEGGNSTNKESIKDGTKITEVTTTIIETQSSSTTTHKEGDQIISGTQTDRSKHSESGSSSRSIDISFDIAERKIVKITSGVSDQSVVDTLTGSKFEPYIDDIKEFAKGTENLKEITDKDGNVVAILERKEIDGEEVIEITTPRKVAKTLSPYIKNKTTITADISVLIPLVEGENGSFYVKPGINRVIKGVDKGRTDTYITIGGRVRKATQEKDEMGKMVFSGGVDVTYSKNNGRSSTLNAGIDMYISDKTYASISIENALKKDGFWGQTTPHIRITSKYGGTDTMEEGEISIGATKIKGIKGWTFDKDGGIVVDKRNFYLMNIADSKNPDLMISQVYNNIKKQLANKLKPKELLSIALESGDAEKLTEREINAMIPYLTKIFSMDQVRYELAGAILSKGANIPVKEFSLHLFSLGMNIIRDVHARLSLSKNHQKTERNARNATKHLNKLAVTRSPIKEGEPFDLVPKSLIYEPDSHENESLIDEINVLVPTNFKDEVAKHLKINEKGKAILKSGAPKNLEFVVVNTIGMFGKNISVFIKDKNTPLTPNTKVTHLFKSQDGKKYEQVSTKENSIELVKEFSKNFKSNVDAVTEGNIYTLDRAIKRIKEEINKLKMKDDESDNSLSEDDREKIIKLENALVKLEGKKETYDFIKSLSQSKYTINENVTKKNEFSIKLLKLLEDNKIKKQIRNIDKEINEKLVKRGEKYSLQSFFSYNTGLNIHMFAELLKIEEIKDLVSKYGNEGVHLASIIGITAEHMMQRTDPSNFYKKFGKDLIGKKWEDLSPEKLKKIDSYRYSPEKMRKYFKKNTNITKGFLSLFIGNEGKKVMNFITNVDVSETNEEDDSVEKEKTFDGGIGFILNRKNVFDRSLFNNFKMVNVHTIEATGTTIDGKHRYEISVGLYKSCRNYGIYVKEKGTVTSISEPKVNLSIDKGNSRSIKTVTQIEEQNLKLMYLLKTFGISGGISLRPPSVTTKVGTVLENQQKISAHIDKTYNTEATNIIASASRINLSDSDVRRIVDEYYRERDRSNTSTSSIIRGTTNTRTIDTTETRDTTTNIDRTVYIPNAPVNAGGSHGIKENANDAGDAVIDIVDGTGDPLKEPQITTNENTDLNSVGANSGESIDNFNINIIDGSVGGGSLNESINLNNY